MKLTTEQIDEFNTHGVIIARGALIHDDQQPLIDELSAWIGDRARVLHQEGKIADLHQDAPFATRYGLLFKQCTEIGQDMDIMHYRGRAVFEFLRNENLLDLLESLLGPELTCNPIQHLRSKPPQAYENREGSSFHNAPWHQDAGVMMPEAEGSDVVTCWFPLAEAMVEHGCMEVLPGQVDDGYLRHQKAGGTTIVPEAPEGRDCPVVFAPVGHRQIGRIPIQRPIPHHVLVQVRPPVGQRSGPHDLEGDLVAVLGDPQVVEVGLVPGACPQSAPDS